MVKPITRVSLRKTVVSKQFNPTTPELQTDSVKDARKGHNQIGSRGVYIWCDWSNSIGILKVNLDFNYCDKCLKVLWSTLDKSPDIERVPWLRPGNKARKAK